MRGDAASLGNQLVRRLREGGPADRDRARAAGAASERDRRGITLQYANFLGRYAEPLGGELRVSGLMPLPGGLRPHQDRQRAALVEAQFGKFVGRETRLLDINGMAEPAITAARPRLGAPPRKAGEVGCGERLVHVAGEVPAVVIEPERRLV